MKLKFETTSLPDDYVRAVWKRHPKESRVAEYSKAIEDMKIGQSFETQGVYCVTESIRAAFKVRGWKCTCRTTKVVPDKYVGQLRVFKIRVWRIL